MKRGMSLCGRTSLGTRPNFVWYGPIIVWANQPSWYGRIVDAFDVALWGSTTFPRVLATVLQDPDREFAFAELVDASHANRESVHRAVRRGLAAGLVRRRKVGNQFVYRANKASAVFAEMRALSAKTHGLRRLLGDALAAAGPPQVETAFIFGSEASGRSRAESDVDVLVVGDATRIDLARILRAVGGESGRRINALAYPRTEIEKRLAGRDAFFIEVWAQPKLMLVGSEDDLPVAPQPAAHQS
jgi:hypothetical protein